MKKAVVAKVACISSLFGLGIAGCNCLSSCSMHLPSFQATSTKTTWLTGVVISVTANWEGYYLQYVNYPPDSNDIDYNGHQNDIEFVSGSRPYEDTDKKIETSSLVFKILTTNINTDPWSELDSFSIYIHWKVKNTSINKTSTITISQQRGDDIVFSSDYIVGKKPIDVDEPNLPDNEKNCLDCIKQYYVFQSPLESVNKMALILNNLYNDTCFWTDLAYQQSAKILIDDKLEIYSYTENDKWKVNINFDYDCKTQIFKFFKISFEGSGTLKMGGMDIGDSSISGYFCWGACKDFDFSKNLGDGPKLMGAFNMNTTDQKRFHKPIYYTDKAANEYSQTFLSLVPSSNNSYSLSNITITPHSTIFPSVPFGSGYHVYHEQQPRNFGLEFATGTTHISVPTQGHSDAFRNAGLNFPSYCLTNNLGNTKLEPRKINIDSLVPKLTNKLQPGNADFFANYFLNSQPWNDKRHNQDPDDWDFDIDPVTSQPIDPNDFINYKIKQFSANNECIGENSWNNIEIINSSEHIPWFQAIQQYSLFPGRGDGNNFALQYAPDPKFDPPPPIKWDNHKGFVQFAIGLNYMFVCSDPANMMHDADNVFQYTGANLQTLNRQYQNS